jgi:ABC-type Zn2+ transport system, periplasmic component/surface adhesin
MKRNILIPFALALTFILPSCVEYEAEPFTGKTLPRKTGYSTGVTNDWLYFNLENGNRYNVLAPNRDIKEGQQKDSIDVCMDWDIAFCGYRVRTNSGTSGPGRGGAVDLGYGGYETWTSKSQVMGMDFVPDDESVYVTMSQNDWIHYCVVNHMDIAENPWFDPNNGPAKTTTSANPILAEAMDFAGPPPVYTPSFHTYAIRSADGKRYYKLQIISWYNAEVEIGDEGGRMSYYLDELH